MTGLPRVSDRGTTVRRLALLGAGIAALGMLLYVGRWLTFWYDEWSVILDRPTPSIGSLLAPHVDHLSTVAVAVYQLLLHAVGMASYWPYLAVAWTAHLASSMLLYRIVRHRAGTFVGAVAAISLLTLGAAWEDVLHAFQLSFLISVAFGLLAVDRLLESPAHTRTSVVALVALLVAVGSSSVGVLFTGLILVWGLLSRRREVLGPALVAAILYAAWYLTWGRSGQGVLRSESGGLIAILATFMYGIGASVTAPFGLAPYARAPWGIVVGAALALGAWARGHRPGALGLAALAALAAEYGLQAAFRSAFGIEYAARSAYLYPGVVFLWIAAGDMLVALNPKGPSNPVRLLVAAGLIVAIAGGATQFLGAGRAMRVLRVDELAVLRLIEEFRDLDGLSRDVSPDEELVPQVTPDRYLVAIDRFGSPRLWIEGSDPDVVRREATPSRVNAAALRLLEPGFKLGGPAAPPAEAARSAFAAQNTARLDAEGCVAATHDAEPVVRISVPRGLGFRVDAGEGSRPGLVMGIEPAGLEAPPEPVLSSLRAGGVVVPPDLPPDRQWHVELELAAGDRVCLVSPAGR
jgi:hypothetical protein